MECVKIQRDPLTLDVSKINERTLPYPLEIIVSICRQVALLLPLEIIVFDK